MTANVAIVPAMMTPPPVVSVAMMAFDNDNGGGFGRGRGFDELRFDGEG